MQVDDLLLSSPRGSERSISPRSNNESIDSDLDVSGESMKLPDHTITPKKSTPRQTFDRSDFTATIRDAYLPEDARYHVDAASVVADVLRESYDEATPPPKFSPTIQQEDNNDLIGQLLKKASLKSE
eukprot:CAMPEP_0117427248 /NCGR_PEP_ID=MMETSP0758-20121206/7145_1 /TAXON_ID=63605 /ORGANISM="Percolomonas cosmopolitus, Strain AE-1 (ATCC 50343)" /LENGTH=126 /DNA_ID=CAMNT_0005212793 /DNA_START=604 /DNA_END=984 /DNA_ORIENTATION=+